MESEDDDDMEEGEKELDENEYSDSSEEVKGDKKKSGKKALRAQLRQE